MNGGKYIKLTVPGRSLYLNVNCVEAVLKNFDNKTQINTIGTDMSHYIVDEPIETVLERLGWEPYREDGTE